MSDFIIITRLLGEFKQGIRHIYIKDYFEIREDKNSFTKIIFYPNYKPWGSSFESDNYSSLEIKETVDQLIVLIDKAQGK